MTYNKYKIHHFDLVNIITPIVDDTVPSHYCVFWYRSMPLGHCFISSAEISNETFFWNACLEAILPSIKYYHQDLGLSLRCEILTQPQVQQACEAISQHQPVKVFGRCPASVVICTRNRASHLKKCLDALVLQRCKPFEIIVVDNGSTTPETQKVASLFPGVRYIREDNPGLDIARNTGARAATSPIVAFTDDDTQPHEFWTYRIAETFKDPEVSAMTGLVLAGTLDTEAEVIFEKFWPFNRGYLPKTYDSKFFNATLPDGPPVWEIGAGANMAFRKNIFNKVGYFDERLDVGAAGCSGDSEMWYRILASGYSIKYNPLAVVKHFHRSNLNDLKRQLYSYMKGFTVAILIQYARFGHKGNLQHLFKVVPLYYLSLLKKGFPSYNFQYQTLFSELKGIVAGLLYYIRNRNSNSGILPQ